MVRLLYITIINSDGHGVEGHYVSSFIKEVLPFIMSQNLYGVDLLKENIDSTAKQTFLDVNDKLVNNEEINSTFSGSTCVSVIYTPERLICLNIGDSRAVIGRCINAQWKGVNLSRDHKPTERDEAKRIIDNDGRIQPFIDEGEFIGPPRVWIKEDDVPGLAMTRSFGDRVASTVGVISEPEITYYDFNSDDNFLIIASDGIWEFITSSQCINIIKDFYLKKDIQGCCEYLYNESRQRWIKEEEVVDDITIILVFLN